MVDLARLVEEATVALGFDFYALGHHVDLRIPPRQAFVLIKYPDGWYGRMVDNKYYLDDPVLKVAQRSAAPFTWEDIPRKMKLKPRHRAILEQAARDGLGKGFTIPVNVPGEYWGSCNFGVRPGRELPDQEVLAMAHFLAGFIFEAARRIRLLEIASGQIGPATSLSPRQRDCVVLIARGLSDKEIARVLSIKPDTVHEYVEDAKLRYGVKTRHQLVVHALFNGQLAFADALSPP